MKTYRAGLSEFVRPTISLSYPKRKAQHVLEVAGKVVAVLLVCTASFWLGRQFPASGLSAGSAKVAENVGTESSLLQSLAAKPVAAAPTDGGVFENKESDGLQIQTFTLKPDAVIPGELDYELVLANNGPKLVGEMKVVVQGELDGKPMIWTYPDDARPTDKHIRLSVSKFLKMAGALQLPTKFVPQKAALKLQQDNGLRASRVVQLADSTAAGMPIR